MRSLNSSHICILGWLKSYLGVVLLCFDMESYFVFSLSLIFETIHWINEDPNK